MDGLPWQGISFEELTSWQLHWFKSRLIRSHTEASKKNTLARRRIRNSASMLFSDEIRSKLRNREDQAERLGTVTDFWCSIDAESYIRS